MADLLNRDYFTWKVLHRPPRRAQVLVGEILLLLVILLVAFGVRRGWFDTGVLARAAEPAPGGAEEAGRIRVLSPTQGSFTRLEEARLLARLPARASRASVNGVRAPIEEGMVRADVPMLSGRNRITLEVEVGEAKLREEIFVVRDATPPSIRIDVPADGSMAVDPVLTVKGELNEEHPGTLTVNGEPADLEGQLFLKTVVLREGENEIRIEAVDRAGNEAKSTVRLVLDTLAPLIDIRAPRDGQRLRAREVWVVGAVDEALGGKVLVNGRPADVHGKSFRLRVELHPGPNTIRVTAFDQAGNAAQEVVEVVCDEEEG